MRILVTNDDGIHAPGLAVAEALAAAFGDDVWVVAPADEQSGAGHLGDIAPARSHQPGGDGGAGRAVRVTHGLAVDPRSPLAPIPVRAIRARRRVGRLGRRG